MTQEQMEKLQELQAMLTEMGFMTITNTVWYQGVQVSAINATGSAGQKTILIFPDGSTL